MDLRKELEIAGATDLANNAWESAHGPDGLAAHARGWMSLAQEQLRYLGKYRFMDEAANGSLEADVRRLRVAIYQRERTADELVDAAAAEATNNA